MNTAGESEKQYYETLYENFDSPLMRQIRREAYDEDIGQHSWVTAKELRDEALQLQLSSESHLLDLGCGAGGPLIYIARLFGCRGTGVDRSAHAVAAGRARLALPGGEQPVSLRQLDLNSGLPFADGLFNAVVALDVILHLRDRLSVFREVARVLAPAGRFLFTDAAVVTGSITSTEISLRALHGYTEFVPPGCNEEMLQRAGLRVIHSADRTASMLENASGRLAARIAHAPELCKLEGPVRFERQQRYLETVVALAERGALARMLYLAQSPV